MKIMKAEIFIAVYSTLMIMTYLFGIGKFQDQAVYLFMIITPLIPFFFGVSSSRYFGFGSDQGKSMLFMAIAMLFAWIGKLVWTFSGESIDSFGHLFFFALRPLFAIAIFYSLKGLVPDLFNDVKKTSIISASFIILAIAYFFIFPIAWQNDAGLYENSIIIGYQVMDLFLLLFAIFTTYIICLVFSGKSSRAWIFLGVGTISFWISQTYYVSNHEQYTLGNLIDLGWYFGYLFFTMSFILLKDNAQKTIETAQKRLNG